MIERIILHIQYFCRRPSFAAKNFVKGIDEYIVKRRRYKNKNKLAKIFEPIIKTRPLQCNPHAKTELHTLTAHHHLYMYMTALKSFLRYFDDIAIVTHDDGSLTDGDKLLLRDHIKGIKIIDRNMADEKLGKILNHFPNSLKYRTQIINSMELFDNIFLAETDKIISMNSDILFLKEPRELIEWIIHGRDTFRGSYEEGPFLQKEILSEYNCDFPPHITLGLVCFYKEIMDFEFIETILTRSKHDWFIGQNIYPLLFNKKANKYKMHFFNKDTYQASGNFTKEAVFKHYWNSSGLFAGIQIKDSKKIISELGLR